MHSPDIVTTASSGMVYRAKDGTFIQIAIYDHGTVRVLMDMPDGTVVDHTVSVHDAADQQAR